MKLLQTNTYLLLIDEEAEVCRGQHRFLNNKVELIHEGHNYPYKGNKVVAYYPLTKEAKELDLPKLPPFKEVIPNSEYEEGMFGYTDTEVRVAQNAFKEGYKAAQSKQYSLEDIEQILFDYDNVDWSKREHKKPTIMMKEWLKEKIQSLSTQRLPKEFEPIMYPKYTQYYGFEEDDEIPVMTPMTSTNSEGKQEIQGKYVY